MRVVCPACKAAYEVPEARLGGAPRRLRCARCAREWTVAPAAPPSPERVPQTEPEPGPEPERIAPRPVPPAAPAAAQPPPAPRPVPPLVASYRATAPQPPRAEFPDYADEARPRARGAWLGWLLSLIVLAGLVAAAVQYRGEVMRAWPPSERAYGLVGLAPR